MQEKAGFKALSLGEQQEFLISILNKNQLYKNLSEIDDKDLAVDEKQPLFHLIPLSQIFFLNVC
jgi:adenine-specific DNA-methyltransferase